MRNKGIEDPEVKKKIEKYADKEKKEFQECKSKDKCMDDWMSSIGRMDAVKG